MGGVGGVDDSHAANVDTAEKPGGPSPFERVERWLFAPVPLHPLVAARIVFGLVLFCSHVTRIPELDLLYGPSGLAGPGWFPRTRPFIGGYGWDDSLANAIETVLPPPTFPVIAALYALLLVAAVCFAVGFRTRTAGLIALGLLAWLQRARMPFAYWGWAEMLQPFLFYVICSRAGRVLSVDAWLARRRGRPFAEERDWLAPAAPMRLLQVHVCTMYAVSGIPRLADPGWVRGEALYIALSNLRFSKLVIDWHTWQPLLALGTWGAWLLEPTAPFLLWWRRIGPVFAYLLIGMHAGLELLTNVGWWSYIMSVSLLCFVPTAHVRWLLQWLPGGPTSMTLDRDGNARS